MHDSSPHPVAASLAKARDSRRHHWSRRIADRWRSASGPLVALVLLLLGFLGGEWLPIANDQEAEESSAASGETEMARHAVTLTPEKVKAAEIQTTSCERRQVQTATKLPGTLQYNEQQHVALRAPVDCTVQSLRIQVGDWVEAGQELAVLRSTTVGSARDEVEHARAEREMVESREQWMQRTSDHVRELIEAMRRGGSVAELQVQFDNKVLGDHRATLFAAYSRLQMATRLLDRTQSLDKEGVLSGRQMEERTSAREVADAEFASLCEQALFESQQALTRARLAIAEAERTERLAKEKLASLLGPYATADGPVELSDFPLRAPFAGRITEMPAALAARFQAGETILDLADTRTLWVAAQIPARDWDAIRVNPGDQVSVTSPSLPDHRLTARVRNRGTIVSPTTLTIPLVGELENHDNQLRPGMFAWIEIPTGTPHDATIVPPSAIQRMDNDVFLFVETRSNTFERVDVQIAQETPEWVEIASTLPSDARVVDRGAFYLKSELLLEAEE